MKECTVRLEKESEYRAVENLVRESFWNVYRPGAMEHYVLHCFRENADFIKELGLVLEKDGELIGYTMYVRSELTLENSGKCPILILGPICIANEYKRQGYGKILLDASLEKAKELGFGGVVMQGNIDFYGKSGFTVAKEKGIIYGDDPEAEYLLCLELKEGYFDGIKGTFKDHEGYFVCQNDAEGFAAFDAEFPKKEKKKLPGQLFSE